MNHLTIYNAFQLSGVKLEKMRVQNENLRRMWYADLLMFDEFETIGERISRRYDRLYRQHYKFRAAFYSRMESNGEVSS